MSGAKAIDVTEESTETPKSVVKKTEEVRKYPLKKYLQQFNINLDIYVKASLLVKTKGMQLSKEEWAAYLSKVRS